MMPNGIIPEGHLYVLFLPGLIVFAIFGIMYLIMDRHVCDDSQVLQRTN